MKYESSSVNTKAIGQSSTGRYNQPEDGARKQDPPPSRPGP